MNVAMTIIGLILLILGLFGTIFTLGFGLVCTGPMMLIGFILFIVGLAIPAQQTGVVQQPSQYIQPQLKNRYCPGCGRSIPFDANLCPYCGKKFEE